MKKKLLHQHQVKSGGTSLNSYFASKFYANKVLNPADVGILKKALYKNRPDNKFEKDQLLIFEQVARHNTSHFDCVHGHMALQYATDNHFFTYSVIRDPVQRVHSQINDWRRLTDNDLIGLPEDNRSFKQYVRDAQIEDIMQRSSNYEMANFNLQNNQCKSIYNSIIGPYAGWMKLGNDQEQLFELAKIASSQFDFIGLTENIPATVKWICKSNGWCPPQEVIQLNKNKKKSSLSPEQEASILSVNKADSKYYHWVKNEFGAKNFNYGLQDFENLFAEARTEAITPISFGNTFLFDFNMPIIGNGFFPRDAANTSDCAIWTGSGLKSTFFFPVPVDLKVGILFYVKGYADDALRGQIQFNVDGVPKDFEIISSDKVEAIFKIKHETKRRYVRCDLEIPQTFSNPSDERKRGISLLKYGYVIE